MNPTLDEAEALTGWSEDVIRSLAVGPFALDAEDRISPRALLGIALAAGLRQRELMPMPLIVAAAVEAANNADPDGGRHVVIAFSREEPSICWADGPALAAAYARADANAPARRPHV